MGTVSTEALALRRTPFGETSQVAEFMTADHGRVSLILKGVHRSKSRMGGAVDLLDHCRLVYSARRGSRSLSPLRERVLLSNHPGMRSREDLLAAGLHLVELLQALATEGQPMPQLFRHALAFLSALDRRPPPAAVPALVFALEGGFLRMTGFEPVLDRCVSCDRRPAGHRVLRCDPLRGGIVCAACREPDDDSFPLAAAAAGLLSSLAGTDPRELSAVTFPPDIENDLRRFYYRTFLHVLERKPRCLLLPVEAYVHPPITRLRLGLPAVLCLLAAGCANEPLGDPSTALARVQALEQQGDTKAEAKLAGRLAESQLATPADRAEGAFLAGEAELAQGEHAKAFERYRYILENAPWSTHAAAIEDRLYEIGKTLLFGEQYSGWFSDRTRGVEALETLTAHYRSSERADDALKLCGDYFAGDDVRDWGEASLHYLRVADEYPDSEWAERCLWLAGHCQLQLANGPQYDRNDLLQARETLERSVTTHPRGVAVKEARADLADAVEKLAAAELVVADFYSRRGEPAGENLRLANAALLYPQTEAGRLAAARLAAQGLDLAVLRSDPKLNSLDKVKATRPVWEQGREHKTKHNAFGPAL